MTQMIEVSVAEATGAALDWMVAKAIKADVWLADKWIINGVEVQKIKVCEFEYWSPSTNWGHAGPLIEKHRIDISAPPLIDTNNEIGWQARPDDGMSFWKQGSTPLIAACRAIVTAKLGDKVMVPVELVGGDL